MQRGTFPVTHSVGPAPPTPRRTAVIVVHGIGEQVQFETLDRAVQGLRRVGGDPQAVVNVRAVKLGAEEHRRAELDVDDTAVHLYEGYWAPITAGQVTMRDVVFFLGRGATNGIQNAWSGFARYMFGKIAPRQRQLGTLLGLVLAAAIIASLAIVDLVALAVAAQTAGLQIPTIVLPDATWLALVFVLCVGLVVATIGVAAAARKARRAMPPAVRASSAWKALFVPAWIAVGIAIAAAIACGGGILVLLALNQGPFFTPPPAWLVWALWGGLFLASLAVRSLFIAYVGDIAAYVSPQALDRFTEIRSDIKKAVSRVAEAVYSAREPDGSFTYDRIAFVGHSLGSVVAYDTLNGLIKEDNLGADRNAAKRTCLLLTFGSPLDKTAFIFATSASKTTETREALATLSQPMILDAKNRPFPWVNVYSRADVISGALDLYHPLDGSPPRVTNIVDAEATTPLAAHNEYWENDLVWTTLRDALHARSITPTTHQAPRVPTA